MSTAALTILKSAARHQLLHVKSAPPLPLVVVASSSGSALPLLAPASCSGWTATDVAGCDKTRSTLSTALLLLAAGSTAAVASTSATRCEQPTQMPAAPKLTANLQQRMTSVGHFSLLSETKYHPSIITFVMTCEGSPLTRKDLIKLWSDKQMGVRHTRFHSVVAPGRPGYFQTKQQSATVETGAKKTTDDDIHSIAKNVSEMLYPLHFRQDIAARVRHLQMTRWDLSDALWHMWVAPGHTGSVIKTEKEAVESVVVFRGHHALADGASIVAAFLDLFDEAEHFSKQIVQAIKARRERLLKRTRSWWERFLHQYLFRLAWWIAGSFKALLYQTQLLLEQALTDEPSPWRILEQEWEHSLTIAGTQDDPALRRTISWTGSAASVDQVKWVAQQLGQRGNGEKPLKLTVNDIFVSCVTAAIAKQLQQHRMDRLWRTQQLPGSKNEKGTDILPIQRHINIAIPVHLKGGVVLPDESVGNNIGAMVVRLPGETTTRSATAKDRLLAVHKELAQVKHTPAAQLSYLLVNLLSWSSDVLIPSSWLGRLYQASNAGSVAVVTNARGPPIPVHIDGRKVTQLLGFVPLPPGIGMGIVVSSYAGNMHLTLTAEPWAIPNADQFLQWTLQEYLELARLAKEQDEKGN